MSTAQTTSMDQKVVVMKFDNSDFEKNTKETMSTLDKLKEKLRFDGATKGIEDISVAAKKTDLSPITKATIVVEEKFKALQVSAITTVDRITTSALQMGKSLIKSMSGINNVTDGWDKMVKKTGNVQTLVNSTGLSINEINKYLDKLMWYSDETSYGFTDMTDALANMTATGGDIKKLVPMIIGMANATAYAGKGASEFTRVIYNLNQSYGAGALTLMDWKSVQNAGAASKQLKEELIKAGEELGTIQKKFGKKGAVDIGNFNNTLQKGWATSAVMEKAFTRFGEFTEEVHKYVEDGYQASEAIALLSSKYKGISVTAFRAAQEAKSFKEAVDATTDAASSKWSQVFATIFGDYDEQKRIWTELANAFYDWFVEPIENLNDLLLGAFKTNVFVKTFDEVSKAVDKMNKSINSVSNAVEKATLPLKEYQKIVDKIWNGDYKNQPYRKKLLEQAGYNYNAFQYLVNLGMDKNGHYTHYRITMEDVNKAQKLYGNLLLNNKEVTKKQVEQLNDLKDALMDVNKLTDKQLDKLKESKLLNDTQIKYYKMLRDGAKKYGMSITDLTNKMKKYNAHDLLFGKTKKDKKGNDIIDDEGNKIYELEGALQNIMAVIDNLRAIIANAWNDIFKYSPIDIYMFADSIKNFTERLRKLTENATFVKNLTDVFRGLFAILKLFTTSIGGVFKIVWTIIKTVFETFGKTALDLGGFLGNLTASIAKLTDTGSPLINFITKATEVVAGFIKMIYQWFQEHVKLNDIFEFIKQSIKGFIEDFKNWLEDLKKAKADGTLKEFLIETFVNVFKHLKKVIKEGFSGVIDWLVSGFGETDSAIGKWFQGLGGAKEGKTLGKYIIDGLVQGISTGLGKLGDIIKFVFDVIVGTFKGIFQIHSPSKVTEELGENVGEGFGIGLEGAINALLEFIPKLFGSVGEAIVNIIKDIDLTKIAIFGFGIAAFKVGKSVAQGINLLGQSVQSVNGVINAFSGVLNSFTGVLQSIRKRVAADILKTIAISIAILVASIFVIVKLLEGPNGIENVLLAVTVIGAFMGAMVLILNTLDKGMASTKNGQKNLIKLSGLMLSLSISFLILGIAIKKISKIDNVGIWNLALVLLTIVTFIGLIAALTSQGKGRKKTISQMDGLKETMLAISGSLLIMAKAIRTMASVKVEGLKNVALVFGLLIAMLTYISVITKISAKNKGVSVINGLQGTLLSIGALMLSMAITMKILGSMPSDKLGRALSAITWMSGIITGLMLIIGLMAKLSGGNISSIGGTLAAIALMFISMSLSIKILGSMQPDQLTKGIVIISIFGAIISGLLYVISSLSPSKLQGMILTLLGISTLILALTASVVLLGILPTDMVAKGTAFVSILSILVAGLTKVASDANKGGDSRATGKLLISMVAMIATLAISLLILSFIDPVRLIAPTLSMGSLLIALTVLFSNLNKIKVGSKAKQNLSWMLIVLASMAGITFLLGKHSDGDNAVKNAIAIAVMLGAVSLIMVALDKMGGLSGKALLGILGLYLLLPTMYICIDILSKMNGIKNAEKNALVLSAFLGAMTLILLLTAAVGAIYFATFGVGALGLLGLLAILGMCYMAIDVLKNMTDMENAEKNADILTGFLGKLTDILVKLAIIGPFLAIAVVALAGLSVLMAAMLVFATAVGALMTKVPELKQFLSTGIEIMIQVAAGLGEMIGAFVKGALLKISEVLPTLGLRLSQFMINATPFMLLSKLMTKDAFLGVTYMAAAVAELSVAQLLSNIVKFISLGESFETLGTKLSQFIISASPFILMSKTIDKSSAEGAKYIAEACMYITAGQLLQQLMSFFKGDTDLETFAEQIPYMGSGIKGFVTKLGKFDNDQLDTVKVACEAIKALGDTASKLPGENGWWQKIFGGNSLENFAGQFKTTAQGLVDFISILTTGKISNDKLPIVNTACDVIKTLSDTAKDLPNDQSWVGKIFGGNKKGLGAFADEIKNTGSALAEFIQSFSKVSNGSAATTTAVANVIIAFAEIGKLDNLDTLGDLINKFTGKLPKSAKNLKTFIDEVSQYDATTIDTAKKNCVNVAQAIYQIIKAMSTSVKDNSSTLVNEFKSLVDTVVNALKTNDMIDKFKNVGIDFVKGLKNGIKDNKTQQEVISAAKELGDKVKNAIKVDSFNEHSPSKETYEIGKYFDEGLTNGILDYAKYTYKAASSVGDNAKNGLTDAVSKISDAINSDIDTQPTIRPVLDLSDISNGAGLINSMLSNPSMQLMSNLGSISYGINTRRLDGTNNDVVDAIDKLGKNIGNTGDIYNINGVTYDDGSAVSNAVAELIRAVNIERRV